MSKELLESNKPEDILAALLQHYLQGELDEKKYTEIKDVVAVDTKGKTRLFVKQGKMDGLTPVKLMSIIQDKCDIASGKIRDIKILDKFSFVTLPFNEAEKVLTYFKKRTKGSNLYIAKAKKETTQQRRTRR